MSFDEIIKTATVVMDEELEQIGTEEDITETRSLTEVLLASECLKTAMAKICDVQIYNDGQQSSSYFSFSEPKWLNYLYRKYIAVQRHLATQYVKNNETLIRKV
jgi:hypothetical protein